MYKMTMTLFAFYSNELLELNIKEKLLPSSNAHETYWTSYSILILI